MINFVTRSLMGKLVVFFLLVALLPVGIVGYLAFGSARAALERAEFDKLLAATDARKKEIVSYLRQTVISLKFLSGTRVVKGAFIKFAQSQGSQQPSRT